MSAVLLGSCALAAAASGFPLHLTDALGRQVTMKALPQRIVSLAPSNTERLFAVGAWSTVVGVTTVDTYPPEVAALPKVGGFVPKSISIETIRSEEHTSELQSRLHLVCRLLLEKKKKRVFTELAPLSGYG